MVIGDRPREKSLEGNGLEQKKRPEVVQSFEEFSDLQQSNIKQSKWIKKNGGRRRKWHTGVYKYSDIAIGGKCVLEGR